VVLQAAPLVSGTGWRCADLLVQDLGRQLLFEGLWNEQKLQVLLAVALEGRIHRQREPDEGFFVRALLLFDALVGELLLLL